MATHKPQHLLRERHLVSLGRVEVRKHTWTSQERVAIVPCGALEGALEAPSSKSVTNRLLVIAALADGASTLDRILSSDDTEAMVEGLRSLGVSLEDDGGRAVIEGTAGRFPLEGARVDARLSGTTLRFLSAVSVLATGRVVIDGAEPLRRRPVGALIDALRAVGADVQSDGGRPPLTIAGGGLTGGELHVDATSSSQFASALLMVGPYAERDLELSVHGLGATGYVRLTTDAMNRWGASVEEVSPSCFAVRAGAGYKARNESVEHDASAAAHLYALAVATGGSVRVSNAFDTLQPDGGICDVLAAMGASVMRDARGTTVSRPGEIVGVDVELSGMPDQLATVAVLAALARGDTVIRGVAVARGHESDRIHAVATELRRLGASVEEAPDGLVVHGGSVLHGGTVETYRDHRIAMAFTALGAVVPGLAISDPGCVAKTYPAFFDDVARLGVRLA